MRKWGEAGSVPPWLCPGSKCLLLLGCGCCQWPHQEKWEWEGKALMVVSRCPFSPAVTFTRPLHKYCSSMWPFKAEEKNMWNRAAPKGRYKQLLPGLPDVSTLGCVTACRRNPCEFRDLHIFKMPSSCNSSWAIFYLSAVLLPALGYRPLLLLQALASAGAASPGFDLQENTQSSFCLLLNKRTEARPNVRGKSQGKAEVWDSLGKGSEGGRQ